MLLSRVIVGVKVPASLPQHKNYYRLPIVFNSYFSLDRNKVIHENVRVVDGQSILVMDTKQAINF